MEQKNQQEDNKKESIKKKGQDGGLLLYLHDFVTWLVVIVLVFLLVFRVVVVSGHSMNPTLQHGDYVLLINNIFYFGPKQGDVVVASKDAFKDGEPIIKRLIATEGQWVDIDFDAGIVYVNGTALDEPYVNTPTNLEEGVSFPLMVEEGCVFVLGDNRNGSKDSRSVEIGQIDKRELLGKAIFLFLPGRDEETGAMDFTRIGALT